MEIEEKIDQCIAKWKVLASDYELEKYERKACEEACRDFKELKQSLALKQEKVEVPESFDTDYKAHSHLFHNKSEMLSTAMGGIYRTIFPSQFDGKNRNIYRTGIDWNNWSSETILWASRNYEDFCLAVISGNYTVKKEPLYEVVFLEDNSDRWLLMQLSEKRYEIVPESENDGYRTQWFTEKQIKEINKNYWIFKKLVEEEAFTIG